MKVDSKIYKGIEFIQLNELPPLQRDKLLQSISHNLFIKIMIDGKIVNQCLQYRDYSVWYETVYRPLVVSAKEPQAQALPLNIEHKLALNKI